MDGEGNSEYKGKGNGHSNGNSIKNDNGKDNDDCGDDDDNSGHDDNDNRSLSFCPALSYCHRDIVTVCHFLHFHKRSFCKVPGVSLSAYKSVSSPPPVSLYYLHSNNSHTFSEISINNGKIT